MKIDENKNDLISRLNQIDYISNLSEDKEGLVISLKNRKHYKDLLKILSDYEISKINELELSLEDLFLKLINNK